MKKVFLWLLIPGVLLAEISESSLLSYRADLYTEHGEDGIMEEILKRMRIHEGFVVDVHNSSYANSLSRALFQKGFRGVCIDDRPAKKIELAYHYSGSSHPLCVKERVQFLSNREEEKLFDAVAQEYFPKAFIDVLILHPKKSGDLFIRSLERRPKVLAIHSSFLWHPKYPSKVELGDWPQPMRYINQVLAEKGYVPICLGKTSFYILKGYAMLFKEFLNDFESLWYEAFESFPEEEKARIIELRQICKEIRSTEGSLYINL